jgi:1,4-alpha-glucan branching enzyme/maltooligosyltrehalose trehalohydrolase
MLDFYRSLLALRQDKIIPHLANLPAHSGAGSFANGITAVNWKLGGGVHLRLLANLSAAPATVDQQHLAGGEQIFALGGIDENSLRPWSVIWSIERP